MILITIFKKLWKKYTKEDDEEKENLKPYLLYDILADTVSNSRSHDNFCRPTTSDGRQNYRKTKKSIGLFY